jgi:hypothetical protein
MPTLGRTLGILLAVGLAVPFMAATQAAHAETVPLTPGDVLAGTGNGEVKQFSPTGTLRNTLDNGSGSEFTTGMCFNSSGDLFVTNFSTGTISEFDPDGNLLNAKWATVPTTPESCTVDASDNMYVGGPSSATIYEFDPSGLQINSFAVTGASASGGTDWIDLAADQCTILYTGQGNEILSYNVCSRTQNPDLTTSLPGPCAELRIRPNGEVMVACAPAVVRLDSSGNALQSYPVSNALFSMNLDPDGTTFWTGDSAVGQIFQVRIDSGAVVESFNSSPSTGLFGLSIVGGVVVSQPTLTLTPSTATSTVGTPDTLTATITNPSRSVSGQTVTFAVVGANSASDSGTTDANGQATFTYIGTNTGIDTVTATFTNERGATATATATVDWVPAAPATALKVNPATGDFADPATVSARLTNSSGPVAGKTVTLTLNDSESCKGITDATGTASCVLTPGEAAGKYSLDGIFAGDSTDLGSSGSATFMVTLEETDLSLTSPTSAINGQPFALSGTLVTDDPTADTALGGKMVTFTLGSGNQAQSCMGATDSTGSAHCTIQSVNQTVGPSVPIAATFGGDTFYQAASAASSTDVFAPAALGAFVIGDLSAGAPTAGTPVNFWGAQWAQSNSLSGGNAPSSMKGFIDDSSALSCGSTWTASTGNRSAPPRTLSSPIEVIVSSSISQTGSAIHGNVLHIVLVQVNPGYGPAPGHPGTGTIIGVVC